MTDKRPIDTTTRTRLRRRPPAAGRRVLAVAAVLLLCLAAVPPAAALAHSRVVADEAAGVPSVGGVPLQVSASGDGRAGNATVSPHTDPDAVRPEAEDDRLRAYLATQLAERLGQSVLYVERGEYERARAVVGDDYDDLLARYVEVTGEDGAGFRETRDDQRRFVDTVESFEATSEAYREARRTGDVDAARRHARELTALAATAEETVPRLTAGYAEVGAATGVDFAAQTATVERIGADMRATGEEVRSREFLATTTRVTASTVAGSFAVPIVVEGVLATADGAPVANRSVEFAVGETLVWTETDADGAFSLPYRPVSAPVGPGTLVVEYRPAADSVHLGSNDTAPVDVAAVVPTVGVEDLAGPVSYGDRVRVAGQVTVDGAPVPGVNVTVGVGDAQLGVARTNSVGRYVLRAPLPASVPAGQQLAVVTLPGPGLALDPASAATGVDVAPTGTAIALSVELAGESTVDATGRLTTATGRPVAGQAVALRVDGQDVGAVTTGVDGGFAGVVPLPDGRTGRVPVEARFAGAPNLGGTAVSAAVEVASPPPELPPSTADRVGSLLGALGIGADDPVGRGIDGLVDSLLAVPSLAWLVGPPAVVVVVAAVVALRRRLSAAGDDAVDDGSGPATDAVAAGGGPAPVADTGPAWDLHLAADRLGAGGYADAIEAAYRTARGHVAAVAGLPNRGTHTEFLAAVLGWRAAGTPGGDAGADVGDLRDLTARYERAVYGPWPATESEARDALADAEAVVEWDGPTGDSPDAVDSRQ